MQKSEPARNLLILHTEHPQDLADWVAVKERVERDAPDIEVRIANNLQRNSVTARFVARTGDELARTAPSAISTAIVDLGPITTGGFAGTVS